MVVTVYIMIIISRDRDNYLLVNKTHRNTTQKKNRNKIIQETNLSMRRSSREEKETKTKQKTKERKRRGTKRQETKNKRRKGRNRRKGQQPDSIF